MTRFIFLTSASTLLLVSGCSLHDVNLNAAPSVQSQSGYSSLEKAGDAAADKAREQWWLDFNRAELNALIDDSLAANQNISAAVARITQARALQIQTRSDLFPKIDAQGNLTDSVRGSDSQSNTKEIGAALNWELDIFNRIGSAALADEFEAVAREEDLRALRLSLSAEVANSYFGATAAHNRLQLLNSQLKTDQDLLELIELRQDNGIGTKVEVLQQKSQVTDSKSLIPPAEADLRLFENRLDVLLGQLPDGANRVDPKESLAFSVDLPVVGVPADLLINRPDLRAAQAELVAADADIAAAIAQRLPGITLTGRHLYSDIASYSGPISTIMGSFVQPLLDWGQRKAEVERNKAVYTEKLAAFTQSYLEAVEDVENALYQESKQREYIKRLDERRKILQETVEETEALYTQGVDDYLPVLNALQDLRGVERDLVSQRLSLINYRILLYKAIGGTTSNLTE